jgi:hypothetical protein
MKHKKERGFYQVAGIECAVEDCGNEAWLYGSEGVSIRLCDKHLKVFIDYIRKED